MNKILFLILVIAALYSCSNNSAVSKQLSGSDSLVINFTNIQTNTVDKTVTTTESNAIKKLIRFADGKRSEAYKCGYNGSLLFYKNGELLGDVSFNYSGEGCQHFISNIKGELTPTAMSNEAADFLKSLAAGRNWY